jgi:hypothetical protein
MVTQLIRLMLGLTLVWPTLAYAGFPSTAIHKPSPAVFNIITLGAVCNGVANDDPLFATATNVIRADPRVVAGHPVTLIVPPGSTCLFGSCSSNYWGFYNTDITVVATGATFTSAGGCLQLGNGNIVPGPIQKAIQTTTPGSSCVSMMNSGDETNYPPGQWIIISGVGFQGGGFPPNWGNFEYQQVKSTPTGQVCFVSPVVGTYKQTWTDGGPFAGITGQCVNVVCYARPYLVLMRTAWNYTIKQIGGTYLWDQNLIINSRLSEFDNVTWTGVGSSSHTCYIPTFSQTIVFNNSTIATCNSETDKLVTNWIVNGGHLNVLEYFSSSILNMTLNFGAIVDTFQGSPQNLICNNSTIGSVAFGSTYGGGLGTFTGTNCHFTGNITNNFNNNGFCIDDGSHICTGIFSAGALQLVGSATPGSGWCLSYDTGIWLPGTHLIWSADAGRYVGFPFTIGDNSFVGLNNANFCGTLTINTTLASAPPVAISAVNHRPTAIPDNMRNWQCPNCTGTLQAIDFSQAGAQNAPLWTYSNLTYTCKNNVANIPNSIDANNVPIGYGMYGNFTSFTFNVTRADTGPNGTLNWSQLGNAHFLNQTTGAAQSLTETVNLKIAGLRTVLPASVTGAQSGDNLNAPGGGGANQWVLNDGTVFPGPTNTLDQDLTSEAASQCPVFTITWQTTR